MNYFFCLLCCCCLIQLSSAQNTARSERPLLLSAEFGGGYFTSYTKPQYSNPSSRLINKGAPTAKGLLSGQIGLRWLDRHYVGLGVENTLVKSEFMHERQDGMGPFYASFDTDYYNIFLQYGFDVLRHQRLALRPLVQLGVAVSEQQEQTQNSTGPYPYGEFSISNLKQQRALVWSYGLGSAFDWEIIDDYLAIGASVKIVGSPYRAVRTYEVVVYSNHAPPLTFETASSLLTLHYRIYLRGYF